MMQAVRRQLVPLGVTLPQPNKDVSGGYFIWLTLPTSLDAESITQKAQEEQNLTILPGPTCNVAGDEDNKAVNLNRNIRLSFTYEDYKLLEEGVARLAKVIKSSLED